jgi:predicted transcriptional regulator
MRRSKLEMSISILEALAHNGPSKITKITYKANMNFSQLKPIIDDLIEKELVEKRALKKSNAVYAATPKARKILSYFTELKELLQFEETGYRYF